NYFERVDNVPVPKNDDVSTKRRKEIEINGDSERDRFDNEEFLIETNMGYLIICGQNQQLKNLNVEEGIVQIQGKVYELTYVDEHQQEKAKGLFSRLFR